jgi:hypothetical protein
MPVFGAPIGRPMMASASSTVRPEIERRVDGGLHPEDADPVGDEARRVLGGDDRLPRRRSPKSLIAARASGPGLGAAQTSRAAYSAAD